LADCPWQRHRRVSPAKPDTTGVQVNRATAQMRSIAERLIEYETPKKDSAATTNIASVQITDRLRPHLATLMGLGGFRALLARALKLAGAELSWLRAIEVNADGTMEGWAAPYARLTPAEFREGRIVLLAQLLGLLVAFIGPALTARLLGEIWPQLMADKVDFGNGDTK
jgi:hypothetical protein